MPRGLGLGLNRNAACSCLPCGPNPAELEYAGRGFGLLVESLGFNVCALGCTGLGSRALCVEMLHSRFGEASLWGCMRRGFGECRSPKSQTPIPEYYEVSPDGQGTCSERVARL